MTEALPSPSAIRTGRVWRAVGAVAVLGFTALALVVARGPDPVLSVVLYLAAAATALNVARGQPVQRWINVVLVVLPAELALMTLAFEPPEQRALAMTPAAVLTRRAALASVGMLCISTWSALLAVARPHRDAATPDL